MTATTSQVKKVKVSDLNPYENNARTHDDSQVSEIAASITEFGFTNPVLIDEENGIIAGHGRVLAAQSLGMVKVPTITLSGLSEAQKRALAKQQINITPSMLRNGIKLCTCADCGAESLVRKDTNPVVCRGCASARGGKAKKGHRRAVMKPCKGCASPIMASLKDVYCSVECRTKDTRENRKCKMCNEHFEVYKSSLKKGTNASGNFCSRPCYEKWLCNTGSITGRGSRWHKIRKESLRRQPFCALCGTIRGLQVHHIVPYRLTFDNEQDNLIPLCTKHHGIVEHVTHEVEHSGSDVATMKMVLGSILAGHSMATRSKLMQIRGN